MLYFAYGSNLNMVQMKRRCPDSIPVSKVKLMDYKLMFNRVADIIESKGDIVEGAVYEVSARDLKNLDIYEGYPRLYKRIDIEALDDAGKSYKAFVYVMVNKGVSEPMEVYYDTIAQGFEDWGISKTTLRKAKKESKVECRGSKANG